MITNQRKPKLAFVVAADKVDEFLKVKTGSIQDAINKSKERRKKINGESQMYKYASEINENNITIQKLCSNNFHLTKGFTCGNDYIDEFLKKKAIDDKQSTTHLIIENKENLLLGFFSLSASGISFNMSETNVPRDKKNRFNISAIEIDFFAINKPFQHLYFDEIGKQEDEDYFLSDILFEKIMEFINELREYVGFRSVVLYSVPNSKDSNKPLDIYQRFDFVSFKDYMEQDRKRLLEGCIPLFKDVL